MTEFYRFISLIGLCLACGVLPAAGKPPAGIDDYNALALQLAAPDAQICGGSGSAQPHAGIKSLHLHFFMAIAKDLLIAANAHPDDPQAIAHELEIVKKNNRYCSQTRPRSWV